MRDDERARLLAKVLACVILVLLYALGGASLWLRERYLKPLPSPTVAPTVAASVETPGPAGGAPGATATPSLYPTITPNLTKTALALQTAEAEHTVAPAP